MYALGVSSISDIIDILDRAVTRSDNRYDFRQMRYIAAVMEIKVLVICCVESDRVVIDSLV